jgi:hypothetical protein
MGAQPWPGAGEATREAHRDEQQADAQQQQLLAGRRR